MKRYIRENTLTRQDYEEILHSLGFKDFNTLVGTQMITTTPDGIIVAGSPKEGWLIVQGLNKDFESTIKDLIQKDPEWLEECLNFIYDMIDNSEYNIKYGTLDETEDVIDVVKNGTDWYMLARKEGLT